MTGYITVSCKFQVTVDLICSSSDRLYPLNIRLKDSKVFVLCITQAQLPLKEYVFMGIDEYGKVSSDCLICRGFLLQRFFLALSTKREYALCWLCLL